MLVIRIKKPKGGKTLLALPFSCLRNGHINMIN